MTNPWEGKTLRAIYDPTTQGYWFSVIDLCAILTGSDYKTAQNYWGWLKNKIQPLSDTNMLKFESSNGKYHFTEVVDFKDLIRIIQICPSPKAIPYKLWLADMFFESTSPEEVEKELAKLGEQAAEEILTKYKDNPNEQYERLTIHKESYI